MCENTKLFMDIVDSRVSWTSSNNKKSNGAKETLLFGFLNSWINGASIQIERIEIDQAKLKIALKYSSKSIKIGDGHLQNWSEHQRRLFLDLHFFLVAVANIAKVMEVLKKIKSREHEFVLIYKKYASDLNRLKHIFRNLLEHMADNPVDGYDKKGKPLKSPGDFGNLSNDNYSLFGETFNIPSTFVMFENLCLDLKEWSDGQVKKFYTQSKK